LSFVPAKIKHEQTQNKHKKKHKKKHTGAMEQEKTPSIIEYSFDHEHHKRNKSDCWHCTYPIENYGCSVPIKYDKKTKKYECIGCFCSWECAKAWQQTRSEYNTPIQRMWLFQMAVSLFGYTEAVIYPAPDPWILTKFGGTVTIEEFHSFRGTKCETIHPPLLPARMTQTSMAVVFGTTSDAIRNISATCNDDDDIKEQRLPEKEGQYHQYLKSVPTAKDRRKKRKKEKEEITPTPTGKKSKTGKKKNSLGAFMKRNS